MITFAVYFVAAIILFASGVLLAPAITNEEKRVKEKAKTLITEAKSLELKAKADLIAEIEKA